MVAKWLQSQKKMGHRFCRYPIDFVLVRPAGIEPAAYCLGGNRSIRLSYERASYLVKQSDADCQVEAGGGKYPVFPGWKAVFASPRCRKNPLQRFCGVRAVCSGSPVRQVQHGAKRDAHGAQHDDNGPQQAEQAQVFQGEDLGQGHGAQGFQAQRE